MDTIMDIAPEELPIFRMYGNCHASDGGGGLWKS